VDAVQASGNDVKTIQFGGWPGDSLATAGPTFGQVIRSKRIAWTARRLISTDRLSERGASRRPPN